MYYSCKGALSLIYNPINSLDDIFHFVSRTVEYGSIIISFPSLSKTPTGALHAQEGTCL